MDNAFHVKQILQRFYLVLDVSQHSNHIPTGINTRGCFHDLTVPAPHNSNICHKKTFQQELENMHTPRVTMPKEGAKFISVR
jgi:hypothetical protein